MKGWILVIGLSRVLAAQTPAFEVATIKPNRSGHNAIGGRGVCTSQGGVSVSNIGLGHLIVEVYGLRDVQVLGRPNWFDSERFDIEARPAAPATYEQCKLMVRTLLAERFGLTAHRETREAPVFFLTVAKNGPKLRTGEQNKGARIMDTSRGRIVSAGVSMAFLARLLSYAGEIEKMVIDSTGLSGYYEFELNWAPQGLTPDGTSGTSIFTALQEQLGLKLEAGRGPVEVLVIDHINRQPTEN
jgi:uncharacterized protein (TIGR03435 family)